MNLAGGAEVSDRFGGCLVNEVNRLDQNVVEVSLLVPQWQVEALEVAARGRGMTTGQMLRRMIRSYCATLPAAD
jgi:hypothetical protein